MKKPVVLLLAVLAFSASLSVFAKSTSEAQAPEIIIGPPDKGPCDPEKLERTNKGLRELNRKIADDPANENMPYLTRMYFKFDAFMWRLHINKVQCNKAGTGTEVVRSIF